MARACLQNVLSGWIPIMTRLIFLLGFSKPCTMVQLDNRLPPVVKFSCQSNHLNHESPHNIFKGIFSLAGCCCCFHLQLFPLNLNSAFIYYECSIEPQNTCWVSFWPFFTVAPLSKSYLLLGRMTVPFFFSMLQLLQLVFMTLHWDPMVRALCVGGANLMTGLLKWVEFFIKTTGQLPSKHTKT